MWFSGRAMLENIKLEEQTHSFFVLLHEKIVIEIEVIGKIIIVLSFCLGFFRLKILTRTFKITFLPK